MRHALPTLVAAIAAPALAGPTVVNGDFATNDLTGWAWTPDPVSEPGMIATTAPGPFGTPPSFRVNPGTAVADTGSRGGTLSQSVLLTAGVPYMVTGDLAIQNVAGGPNADGGTITVRLGGLDVHVFDVAQIAGAATLTDAFASAPFVPAASGPYTLELHFGRDFPNFASNILHYADNIALIPSPGAAALFVCAAMGALRRRR